LAPPPTIFIEKPVSTATAGEAREVAKELAASGNVIGLGYMRRYLKVVVRKGISIICEHKPVVMSVSARYIAAY
jgi:hypothetical protein